MILGNYIGTYIGKEIFGFQKGHKYQFELNNNGRTYELNAFQDITDGISKDLHNIYASEISIRRNWNLDE